MPNCFGDRRHCDVVIMIHRDLLIQQTNDVI